MSKQIVSLALAVICLTGVVLAASEEKQENGLWHKLVGKFQQTCQHACDLCVKTVDRVKTSGQVDSLREQLKTVCNGLLDPARAKKCSDMVDKYADDIQNKTSRQVCEELRMCSSNSKC